MRTTLLILSCFALVSLARAEDLSGAEARLAHSLADEGARGFASHLARDAVYLHPDAEATVGRAAIEDQLATLYPAPNAIELHTLAADTSHDGQAGFSLGWLEQADSTGPSYARYLAAWTHSNGCWRIAALARVASKTKPTDAPPGAKILDGERGTAHPGDPDALALEVARADAAFAQLSVDQGYTVAFSAYTAEAAVIVAGSDFYWDRAGVELAWSGWTPAETLSWSPLRASAAASGDFGWSIGYARFRSRNGDVVEDGYSKYLTLWQRADDGHWKFIADGGNARPAP